MGGGGCFLGPTQQPMMLSTILEVTASADEDQVVYYIGALVLVLFIYYMLKPSGGPVPRKMTEEDKKRFKEEEDKRKLLQSTEYTAKELEEFTGENGKPIYLAVKGIIYDVSTGAGFYGPGKPYNVFAGKECSRALAKTSTNPIDVNGEIDSLSYSELETLDQWIAKFDKYPKVGILVNKKRD
eukprot:TRINITY_DN14550_c2_g1_i2.p1 TRINITY_DN14550_c2_g1~~TRINITY_DN14550_c2_g1_i2.p1  ORF type:complete len:183 (-),score=68.69 TRINITY_DN14550_c2_g1_i2:26-574(-)